jgi:hypothetical protein
LLIITNGDSAVGAMEAAGIPGVKLPWRDVLHDGPVPAGLELEELSDVRAHFIASCGWGEPDEVRRQFADRDATLVAFGSHDEVVLWFEHDLYDQLQLLQLLDWFAHRDPGRTRLSYAQDSEFIAEVPHETLPERLRERRDVTAEQLEAGHLAWAAFTAPEPGALERWLEANREAKGSEALPFLGPAIARLLEEYPDATTGLARSERQILEGLADGERSAGELFRAVQAMEEARYLGDGSFFSYVQRLTGAPEPLIRLASREPFRLPAWDRGQSDPPELPGPLELTATGRQALAGERNWIEIAGIDRWIGGVHLNVPPG